MRERIHAPELHATAWLNVDRPISIRELRGQVVVLDFWTSCCVNCMHVLPVLRDLEERHAADPLVVIGVHSAKFEGERAPEQILSAMERYGVAHPVAVDSEFRIWREYAVRSWPTLIVLRPDGTLAAIAPGEPDPAVLEGVIQEQLAQGRKDGTLAKEPLHRVKPRAPVAGPLEFPSMVRADSTRIVVSDAGHHRVLVLDHAGNVLETIGSGLRGMREGSFAECVLDEPQGLALDGDTLFIADARAHVIWQADLQARVLKRLAGTGELGRDPLRGASGLDVPLRSPWGLAVDQGKLYVALAGSHQLATIDLEARTLSLLAGSSREALEDGTGVDAALAQPSGIALADRALIFADSESSGVRLVELPAGRVHTLVGGPGLFDFGDKVGAIEPGMLQHPLDVCGHPEHGLLVADTYNGKVKRIPLDGRSVELFFEGDLSQPASLCALPDGELLVADTNHHRLLRIRDGRALPFEVRGAPKPQQGAWSGEARPVKVASGAGWFSAIVQPAPGEGLARGAGRLVLKLRAPEGFELNAGAPFHAALEVSRRSDLLKLGQEAISGTTSGGVEHALELGTTAVHESDVDSELIVNVRAVICDAVDHAACYPIANAFRVPLRLLEQGQTELRCELPLEVAR